MSHEKYPIKLESVKDLDLGVWLEREVTLTFLCRYLPDNHKFNCREVITKSEAFTFHGIIENKYSESIKTLDLLKNAHSRYLEIVSSYL